MASLVTRSSIITHICGLKYHNTRRILKKKAALHSVKPQRIQTQDCLAVTWQRRPVCLSHQTPNIRSVSPMWKVGESVAVWLQGCKCLMEQIKCQLLELSPRCNRVRDVAENSQVRFRRANICYTNKTVWVFPCSTGLLLIQIMLHQSSKITGLCRPLTKVRRELFLWQWRQHDHLIQRLSSWQSVVGERSAWLFVAAVEHMPASHKASGSSLVSGDSRLQKGQGALVDTDRHTQCLTSTSVLQLIHF